MTEPNNTPVFNPADYPRVYKRASSPWEFAGWVFMIVLSVAGILFFITGDIANYYGWEKAILVAAGFIFFGFVMIAALFTESVELTPDSIHTRGLFRHRHLERTDIKGWVTRKSKILLIPYEARIKKLVIDDFYSLPLWKANVTYDAWYQSLPDLDQPDKDQYYEMIKADAALGGNPESRLRNRGRLVDWLSCLNICQFFILLTLVNFYRPVLPPITEAMIAAATILSIFIFFKFPILLQKPPDGINGASVYQTVYLWGAILFFLPGHPGAVPDLPPNLFNPYAVGIFIVLCLPLITDGAWKKFPKRFLIASVGILVSLTAFYFCGNIALDRSQPVIRWDRYILGTSYESDEELSYRLDKSDIPLSAGCKYQFKGAFGTTWSRLDLCPENFQKPEATK